MRKSSRLAIYDIAIFAMLGAFMFAMKKLMEVVPNVHPLTMLTMVYTIVYRKKAIYPIVVYLALDTVISGGITWILPYYYIFPLVWLVTLALPKSMPVRASAVIYSAVCTLFGLTFGIMYAPWQAIMYGLNFDKTVAWIIAGIPFDAMHGIGNLVASFLIIPLVTLLGRLDKYKRI